MRWEDGWLLMLDQRALPETTEWIKLRSSEDVARAIRPDTILVSATDLKSRITHCNRAFVEVSGYSPEELLGQPHNMIRHPDMPRSVFELPARIDTGDDVKRKVDSLIDAIPRDDRKVYKMRAIIDEVNSPYCEASPDFCNWEHEYLLYHGLKAGSVNRGRTDQGALLRGEPQPFDLSGGYTLHRIGDAVAGRNIHAALYDALRLCKDI